MHSFPIRVYYEDTDMAGIVFYANYLRYIERARSDWVRQMGIDQSEMRDEGLIFAVRRVEADYLAPARFDDELTVTTSTRQMTGARLVLDQVVARGDEVLFEAVVTIVCLTVTGQPARLPAHLRQSVH